MEILLTVDLAIDIILRESYMRLRSCDVLRNSAKIYWLPGRETSCEKKVAPRIHYN